MWVRGLKPPTPAPTPEPAPVASYVGAWIETGGDSVLQINPEGRILCGCVD